MIYLDSSALVKLAVEELESEALLSALAGSSPYTTSAVGEIETVRVCRRAGVPPRKIEELRRDVDILKLDEEIRRVAASVGPPVLRTLDAIHLATAQSLGDDLEALVTYNARLVRAAQAAGVPVLSPS